MSSVERTAFEKAAGAEVAYLAHRYSSYGLEFIYQIPQVDDRWHGVHVRNVGSAEELARVCGEQAGLVARARLKKRAA